MVLFLAACSAMKPAQPPDLRLAESHLFGVTQIAFDAEGGRIASAGYQGDVAIWSIPDGRILVRHRPHQEPVNGLVWVAPQQLVGGDASGQLALFDAGDGEVLRQRQTPAEINSLVYLPGPEWVVSGHSDGSIRAFSLPALEPVALYHMGGEVLALTYSQALERIAVSNDRRQVMLMTAELNPAEILSAPSRDALSLRFSHDGRQLAAGGWYRVLYWDLQTGEMREQSTEHWGAVISLDYSPDDHHLITLGRHTDASLRLIRPDNGEVVRRLQGHELCGAAVRFSPDGRYVASGSDDESIRLYDLHKPYRPD